MLLDEWVMQQKQLLDDFVADFERQRTRRRTPRCRIKSPQEWTQLYADFHQIYNPDARIDNGDDHPDSAGETVRARGRDDQ